MNAQPTRFCPACGTPQTDPAAQYCGNCGVTLPTPTGVPPTAAAGTSPAAGYTGAPSAPGGAIPPWPAQPTPVRVAGPMPGPMPGPVPALAAPPPAPSVSSPTPYAPPYTQPYAPTTGAPATGNWQTTMPTAQPVAPPGVIYAQPVIMAPVVMVGPAPLGPAQSARAGQPVEALSPPVALPMGGVFAVVLLLVAFLAPAQLPGADLSPLATGNTGSAGSGTGMLALLAYVNASAAWLPGGRLLYAFVFGYDPGASSAATLLTLESERELLLLLIGLAPLALVCAWWFALAHTRLFKGGGVIALALGATLLCFVLLLLLVVVGGLIVYGVQSALGGSSVAAATTPLWSLALLLLFPGFLVTLFVLSVVCALVGVLFAGVGAIGRHTLPGARRRSVPAFWALLGLGALQVALFALLQNTLMLGVTVPWEQFPLAALCVVAAVTLARAFATAHP